MLPKIVTELGLAVICLICGVNLSNIAKCWLYHRRLLRNSQQLQWLISQFEPECIRREAEEVRPLCGSYRDNILKSLATVNHFVVDRLVKLFLASATLLVSSYSLGRLYLVINLAVLLAMSISPLHPELREDAELEVHRVFTNLYKWYLVAQLDCRDEVLRELPMLANALTVVESTDIEWSRISTDYNGFVS